MEPSSLRRRKPFRMPINSATTNLLLAISQKMDYKSFTRLRKTSRGIRDFVEENIDHYDIRVDKVLNTGRIEGKDGFLFQLDDTPFYGVNYKYPVVWPALCFQGLHFNEVVIFCYYLDEAKLAQTLKAIRSGRLSITQYNPSLQPVSESRPYTTLKVCCYKENDRVDLDRIPDFQCKELTIHGCRPFSGNLLEKMKAFERVVLHFPITQEDRTVRHLIQNIWRGEDAGLLKSITICDKIYFEIDEMIERYFPANVVWDPRQIDLENKPFDWDHFEEATFQYFQDLRIIVFETSSRIILLTIVELQQLTVDLYPPESYEDLTDELTNKFAHLSFKTKKEAVKEVVKRHWNRQDNGNTIFDTLAFI